MEKQISELGPCKRKLEVSLTADEVKAKLDEDADELTRQASIRGFRPGHAPKALVMRQFKEELGQQVREDLMNESFSSALEENELDLIGQPSFENVEFDLDSGLSYEATFEIRPDFELPEYKGITVKRPEAEVTDEQVDEMIDSLRRRRTRLGDTDDDAVTETEDFITCDLKMVGPEDEEIYADEDALVCPNGNYVGPHILEGAGEMFVGKKRGDEITGEVTLPETFREEAHRGKTVTIKATVKGIRRPTLPELDDAFAADFGVETVDQLREQVKVELGNQAEAATRQQMQKQIEDTLLERVDFALPEDLVDAASEDQMRRRQLNMMMQGMRPPEQTDEEKEKEKSEALEETRRSFRLQLIMDKIAEKEKVFATEDDISREVMALAQRQHQPVEKVVEQLEKQGGFSQLRNQVRMNKTMDLLMDKAEIEIGQVEQSSDDSDEAKSE